MTTPTYLTVSEAARLLNLSTETVRDYDARGILRAIRTGGGRMRLFLLADVERLVQERHSKKKVAKAG